MKRLVELFLILSSCGFILACNPKSSSSDLESLVKNKKSKNIALLIGAPSISSRLDGVPVDIKDSIALFQSIDLGFQVIAKNEATKKNIMDLSRKAAAELDDEGTLLLYISSHGLENGSLFSHDEKSYHLREVVAEMKSVRKKNIARAYIVIDACFSGMNVDGPPAILKKSFSVEEEYKILDGFVSEATSGWMAPSGTVSASEEGIYFDQALVLAASKKNETSNDIAGKGGAFSVAWRQTIRSLYQTKKATATIQDMLDQTIKQTKIISNGDHTPVYKTNLKSLLQEKIFDDSSNVPNTQVPPPAPSQNPQAPRPSLGVTLSLRSASSQQNGSALYVAADSSVDNVFICKSTLEVCNQNAVPFVEFASTTEISFPGKKVFKSKNFLSISDNTTATIVGVNSSNEIVGLQQIEITKK